MKPLSKLTAWAHRCRRAARRTAQRGFTMIEMMIALAVLAVLATILVSNYNGSTTKAVALFSDTQTMAQGFIRAKQDMGCYPNTPSVLWSKSAAVPAGLYCGIDGTQVWDGPYVQTMPTDTATGDVKLPGVAAGVLATIATEATPATGLGVYYFIHVTGVPNDVVTSALQKCNGSNSTTATFSQGNCRGTLGAGAGALGTFDYKIEETTS